MPDTLDRFDPVAHAIGISAIFRPLPHEQRKALAAVAVAKHFRKGEFVFREGTSSAGFYVIAHGVINVHQLGDDGTERVIHLFRSGESFAEASLFPTGKYPASARAETDSQLVMIPKAPFLDLLEKDSAFALRLIIALSVRNHLLVTALDEIKQHGVRERLLAWLFSHRRTSPPDAPYTISLETTKASLAAELGTRQETLSRHLSALCKEGMLSVRGREIRVLQPALVRTLLHASSRHPA